MKSFLMSMTIAAVLTLSAGAAWAVPKLFITLTDGTVISEDEGP